MRKAFPSACAIWNFLPDQRTRGKYAVPLVHLVRLLDGVTKEETNVDVDAVVKSAHDTLDK